MRAAGRKKDEIRPVNIIPYYLAHPPGSCLIEMGKTKVVCSAMVEESVPPFLKDSGKGWLTAEYSMLPGSSFQRIKRERTHTGGRTQEIQRLIGRSLRCCFDLSLLGERSILIDCDVLDADGGTRTASITGAYVACVLALKKIEKKAPSILKAHKGAVAAISVGIVQNEILLDLNYEEDKNAEVDMNVVMTDKNEFVEVQGTAEKVAFNSKQLQELLEAAQKGIKELHLKQREVLSVVGL